MVIDLSKENDIFALPIKIICDKLYSNFANRIERERQNNNKNHKDVMKTKLKEASPNVDVIFKRKSRINANDSCFKRIKENNDSLDYPSELSDINNQDFDESNDENMNYSSSSSEYKGDWDDLLDDLPD